MLSKLGITSIEELAEWSLFLDRDGVINRRLVDDYVKHPAEFEYLEESPFQIAKLSQLFKYTFVVTNQQGVGKGIMTLKDVENIHRLLHAEVKRNEGKIDQFYICPDLASENSPNRKPEIGMAIKAQKEFEGIEFAKSIMVGDSLSDMEFGRTAGMKTVFVHPDSKYTNPLVDFVIPSLKEFLNQIV